jgi:hypothetical protein
MASEPNVPFFPTTGPDRFKPFHSLGDEVKAHITGVLSPRPVEDLLWRFNPLSVKDGLQGWESAPRRYEPVAFMELTADERAEIQLRYPRHSPADLMAVRWCRGEGGGGDWEFIVHADAEAAKKLETHLNHDQAWMRVAEESNKAVDAYLRAVDPTLPVHYGMPVDGVRRIVQKLQIQNKELTDWVKHLEASLKDYDPVKVKAPSVVLPNKPGQPKPEGPYRIEWANEELVCYTLVGGEDKSPGTMVMLSPQAVAILEKRRKDSNGALVNWNAVIENMDANYSSTCLDLADKIGNAHRYLADNVIRPVLKYFPEAKEWKPLHDLMGVCSQVDNVVAGLSSQIEEERAINKRLLSQAKQPHVGQPTMTVTDDGGHKTAFTFSGHLPSSEEMRKIVTENQALPPEYREKLEQCMTDDFNKQYTRAKAEFAHMPSFEKSNPSTPLQALLGHVKYLRSDVDQLVACCGRIGRSSVEERDRLKQNVHNDFERLLGYIDTHFPRFEEETKQLEDLLRERGSEGAKRDFIAAASIELMTAYVGTAGARKAADSAVMAAHILYDALNENKQEGPGIGKR